MRVARSNLRAGILTLSAVGAFCLVLWGWLEWRASGRVPYNAWFSKDQGVYGLAPGAPVRIGGIRRGNVTEIVPVIADGDPVRVYNDRGSFSLRAKVGASVRRGVVVAPSIWWRKLAPDGKNANEVTSQVLTDMGAAATLYDCLVEVAPA